ncbi:hypothetical protein [Aliiglaciecola sp. NS0011-25]|uniref:hypothetical protein n=1 Tax=Aliiglaciecola sp. NS0011-25 TaxID=3127654 RepID=UPI0031041B4B
MDIEISWGGYYASISDEDGEITLFRLLDFNRDDYHIAIYQEKFQSIPTLKEIEGLSPFIGHAPLDSRSLLNNKKVLLIGSSQLSKSDLAGYLFYLENFEVPSEDLEFLIQSILEYSKEPPLQLRLTLVEEELQISKID